MEATDPGPPEDPGPPDLCQLEAGVKMRQEGASEKVDVCGTLLMVLADHKEVGKLAKLPGSIPETILTYA